MQPAGQTETQIGSIRGGFFEVQSAQIETGVMSIPTLNNTNLCQGEVHTFDAGDNKTYLWNDLSTNQTLQTSQAGIYYVDIDSAGYKARSNEAVITIDLCVNTNEVNNHLDVQITNEGLYFNNIENIQSIQIYNVSGQLITNSVITDNLFSLNLEQLGAYLISVQFNNGAVETVKVIK